MFQWAIWVGENHSVPAHWVGLGPRDRGETTQELILGQWRGSGASPQQGDLRLSGPPTGQGAGGGARTRDRRVPADLRADSLATVPSTPPYFLPE
ncbi:hypothetical protein PoB_005493500 [Plakobranchus ocellatus]|uniref:Uncharacterized protein n=1 Tax=Plakobranchus ocellatus TaxID=259542 RepID=A0AAV4C9R6_9GAST|nr:hypothetical protein PoB_005493500 [Plakobranchus ocellatus]